MLPADEETAFESKRPLLRGDINTLSDPSEADEHAISRWRWRGPVLKTLMVAIYTITVAMVARLTLPLGGFHSNDYPAKEVLQWETRGFKTDIHTNPFSGKPRPELDGAWHHFLRNDNIRVPTRLLQRQGLQSIEIADTNESIAQLSVFHALHCLKKVRQLLHKDYYYPDADAKEIVFQGVHVDHCLEYIREYVMCKGDTSLVTFHWINGTNGHGPLSPSNKDYSSHQCVNWESLDGWAGEHNFDLFRVDLLRKPQHGLEYD